MGRVGFHEMLCYYWIKKRNSHHMLSSSTRPVHFFQYGWIYTGHPSPHFFPTFHQFSSAFTELSEAKLRIGKDMVVWLHSSPTLCEREKKARWWCVSCCLHFYFPTFIMLPRMWWNAIRKKKAARFSFTFFRFRSGKRGSVPGTITMMIMMRT